MDLDDGMGCGQVEVVMKPIVVESCNQSLRQVTHPSLAKKVSAKVQQREHTPFRNLSPNADPLSDPVDVVAARLTERWLYLRSKELVGLTIYVLHKFEAYLKAVMGDVEWMTTWPADYVAYARTNDLIKPLEESLLFAENDKDEGNQ